MAPPRPRGGGRGLPLHAAAPMAGSPAALVRARAHEPAAPWPETDCMLLLFRLGRINSAQPILGATPSVSRFPPGTAADRRGQPHPSGGRPAAAAQDRPDDTGPTLHPGQP